MNLERLLVVVSVVGQVHIICGFSMNFGVPKMPLLVGPGGWPLVQLAPPLLCRKVVYNYSHVG